MRKSRGKAIVNKGVRSRAKTMVTKAETLLGQGSVDAAGKAVAAAVSALDNAAGQGVIHPNNAARRKSRLMKKANKAASATKKS
jgi:small subunit ribosomal protein S20